MITNSGFTNTTTRNIKPCLLINPILNPHINVKNPTFLLKTNKNQVGFRLTKRICCGPTWSPTESIGEGYGYVSQESFYELLGIPHGGSPSEIKQAYKQLARKYHPDVSPPDRAEEYTKMFIQVREAYETLSDPHTRAVYDSHLAAGLHLVFNARKLFRYEEGWRKKEERKNRWMSQLEELERRRGMSDHDSRRNMSWGARM